VNDTLAKHGNINVTRQTGHAKLIDYFAGDFGDYLRSTIAKHKYIIETHIREIDAVVEIARQRIKDVFEIYTRQDSLELFY